MMFISKKPELTDLFRKEQYLFENARGGLLSILLYLNLKKNDKILIPSYIGWSSREGSGIFDPIAQSNVKFEFYPIKRDLNLELSEFMKLLDENVKACLLVNYFGFPDENYDKICRLLSDRQIIIIEDQAHSLFTHFSGGVSGIYPDFSIFSLHKMLPYNNGGLVINHNGDKAYGDFYRSTIKPPDHRKNPFEYDFTEISLRRRYNFIYLSKIIKEIISELHLLKKTLPDGVIPQTLPVLVPDGRRDEFYFSLNESGFGVVSLYHSLIKEIDEGQFPDAHFLSKNILNLPVHQDIERNYLEEMIKRIKQILR